VIVIAFRMSAFGMPAAFQVRRKLIVSSPRFMSLPVV
jgi:hypothetical protein